MGVGTEAGEGARAAAHPSRPAPGMLELEREPGAGWSGPLDRASLRAAIYAGRLTGVERVRAPGEAQARALRDEAWAEPLFALLERDRRGVRHVISAASAAPATGAAAAAPPPAEGEGEPAAAPPPVAVPVVVPEAPRDRSRLVMIGVGTVAIGVIVLVVAWVAMQT